MLEIPWEDRRLARISEYSLSSIGEVIKRLELWTSSWAS